MTRPIDNHLDQRPVDTSRERSYGQVSDDLLNRCIKVLYSTVEFGSLSTPGMNRSGILRLIDELELVRAER